MSIFVVALFNPNFIDEYQGTLVLDRRDYIKSYEKSIDSARKKAETLAKENPNKAYCIMTVSEIYETTSPKIIQKIINEQGELVLKPQEKEAVKK